MSDPKAEELRLPMAVLNRVVKSCLPNGAAVSKDARTHIMRACIVFIFYLITQAEEHAASKKRKTVNVDDVMIGVKMGGFDTIYDALHNAFEVYKTSRARRSKITRKTPVSLAQPSLTEESQNDLQSTEQGNTGVVAGDIEDMVSVLN